MRLVARFMKPYWALCAVTTVLLLVDVVGALVIPTFAAELLNESATSASFKKMTITAVGMGVAALISGMCAVAGGWCCSQLTSRVGKDIAWLCTANPWICRSMISAISVRHR